MDIKPPATKLPAATPEVAAPPARTPPAGLPRDWQPGQLLLAVVTAKSDASPLLLNIQGMMAQVIRPANLPLEVGQRLELKLLAKDPQLLFQVQTRHSNTGAEIAPDTRSINQALRLVVPRQAEAAPLLANLRLLATQATPAAALPHGVRELSQQIYQQLPTLPQLRQPGRLAELLQQSGPFLEAKLAMAVQQQTPPATELRTQLLRLAALLRTHPDTTPATIRSPLSTASPAASPPSANEAAAPAASTAFAATRPGTAYAQGTNEVPGGTVQHGSVRQAPQPQTSSSASLLNLPSGTDAGTELLRQVEGVLARVQVQQLQSLHAENQGRQLWAMELPLKTDQGIDLFDFRIERDHQQQTEEDARIPWSVTLAFDLAGLGAIRAVISLRGETVSTRFWAEQPGTSTLFSQHLDALRSQFDQVGLEVGRLECHCGTPPAPDLPQEPQLVDEKV